MIAPATIVLSGTTVFFALAWLIVLGRNRELSRLMQEYDRTFGANERQAFLRGQDTGRVLERNEQRLKTTKELIQTLYGTPDEIQKEIDRTMALWTKPIHTVITPLRNELPRATVCRPFFDDTASYERMFREAMLTPPPVCFNKYGDVIDTRTFERRMLDEPMFPSCFESKVLETWHSRFPDPEAFRIKRLYDPFEELYKEPDMKFDINVNTQINGKGQIQVDSALTIDGEVQKISTKLVDLQEKAIATALKDLHYIDPAGAVGLRDRIHDIRHTVADCDLGRTHPRLKEQVNSLTNFFYDAVGEPVPPINDNMFRDIRYVFGNKDFVSVGGAYASTAFASIVPKFQPGDIVRHTASGNDYEILSLSSDEAQPSSTLYTYRSLKDQRNWTRNRQSMEDGRFTRVGQFKK